MEKLEGYASQLSNAAQALTSYYRLFHTQASLFTKARTEIQQSRQLILSNLTQIQILLNEPGAFIQQLATQNQYLACIHWLGEFQVLACIPLSHSVPFEDVAELAGIPESHLRRVVRMVATTGFLHEPEPGHVAHSTLSAHFVTRPSYLDAAMFLAEMAAPAALQMPATSRDPVSASLLMTTASAQQPKVQRQSSAYLQYGLGHTDVNALEPLDQFDWAGLGGATVVTSGTYAIPAIRSLANQFPNLLRLIVQTDGDVGPDRVCPRITLQNRTQGTLQNVHDADVYVIGLPSPSPTLPVLTILDQMASELRAHLPVARASRRPAILMLVPRLIYDHGSTAESTGELVARLHDLSLLQLANERAMEMAELIQIVNSIGDGTGRLGVVRRMGTPHMAGVLLEVRYHAYSTDR
ncbi:uncharacterized protein PGRI_003850 [Penicillium griseofulvum]|uniref:Winged helix-turn-helix transcription repressor DNA-binding n=1 Tax=Penicillium patulum TaxID=5078 RepID=A0A135LWL1_PENPA|nr:uncharacterized protein PGRI_003850 [Penicillium griseofulvum]KXG53335.1 hypothetical protein PGRI_003850 [Penicillium griseofulvum]